MSTHDTPGGGAPYRWTPIDQQQAPGQAPYGSAYLNDYANAYADYGTPPPAPPAPPRRNRWLVALAGVLGLALIALVGLAVVLALQLPGAADPARAGYAYLSDKSAVVVEMRLDLPAGQRDQFVRFVSRFPGMGDAVQVERRMNELLEEAVKTASGGRNSWADDVDPWFEGWVVVGGELPEGGGFMGDEPPFVMVLGSKDRAAAESAMEQLRTGSYGSTDGPGEVTIWTSLNRAGAYAGSYAVTDDAVVLGKGIDEVSQALQIGAGEAPNLLASTAFTTMLDRQPAGRLGFFWLDVDAFVAVMDELPGGPMGNPFAFQCAEYPAPSSMAGTLYLRDGRAIIDMAVDMPAGASLPEMRDSGLAERLPRDTLLFIDSHDVGKTVGEVLACLRDNPLMNSEMADLEEMIGPLDQLLGWAGDTAFGLLYDGTRATGGLVVKLTDQGRANETMGQLRALITAGAPGMVTVREETYNGARLVNFELAPELGETLEAPLPAPSLAYAFFDDLLVIGVDASFARSVIDTQQINSLGSKLAYKRALEAAGGATNGGLMYLDFATAMALVEAGMGAFDPTGEMADEQLADLREYIAALESLVSVATVDGQTATTRVVLTTRER